MSGAPEPDVTVVVPAWGAYAGPPLEEALESIRAQDVPARVVVVDNASEQPIREREGLEVVRTERQVTLGAARNLGFERVGSPFVLFWDADDLMLPGTLRRLAARLRDDPRLVAVAAEIVEGDPPRPHGWPRHRAARVARLPRVFALLHAVWSQFPTIGGALLRSDAVRASGGFADATGGDDWVLGVSLAFRGRVAYERFPGRLYRRHPGSLWEQHRGSQHLRRRAAAVRARVRADRGTPRWARALVPAIAAGQLAAIYARRPIAVLTQRRRKKTAVRLRNR